MQFENAQKMAKLYPDTFIAPSEKDLNGIIGGSTVKVCIAGERFWVTVTEVWGNVIIGIVDNDLVGTFMHGYRLGSPISFKKENVYNIFEG
jgi:hypothetical protein